MDSNPDHYVWAEKYRPRRVEDCILPVHLKATFQNFVDQRNIPNLVLNGKSGLGKTTIAKAMIEQLGCPFYEVNGSLNLDKDKLRTVITEFASSVSLDGKRKYVIIDEADFMTHHVQPALRNFTEQFAKTCGFIFTCNYKNRLMPELLSRCSVIDFKFSRQETPEIARAQFDRTCVILTNEGVKFDGKVIAELLKRHYPDFRKTLIEMQRYAAEGNNTIDSGILLSVDTLAMKNLAEMLKDRNFTAVSKWVRETDCDELELYRNLYDHSFDLLDKSSVPMLVLLIAKYQYQSAFAADKQINLLAFFVEAMAELQFK